MMKSGGGTSSFSSRFLSSLLWCKILVVLTTTMMMTVGVVHAWRESEKCDGHDGFDVDRRHRHLVSSNSNSSSIVPTVDWHDNNTNEFEKELAAVVSTVTRNRREKEKRDQQQLVSAGAGAGSEINKNLRGGSDYSTSSSLSRRLRQQQQQRKLGIAEATIETFQLKMHWEDDYCWQLEAIERRWCMSCAGGSCGEDDLLWIQECNDALIQRFVWESVPVAGMTNSGKLKPYLRQDLCLTYVGKDGTYSHFGVTNPRWWYFLLKPCDDANVDSQILTGFNDDDAFEFLYTNSSEPDPTVRCLSQAHDPRAGEIILGEYLSNARFDKTSLWDAYNLHSSLPATPDMNDEPFCAPWPLMLSDNEEYEVVTDGNTLVNWDADTYVEQYNNGRFVIRRGFPDRPEEVLFDNELDRGRDDYFTKLRGNGDLLTFRGTPDDPKGDSVWKLDFDRPEGVFFLGVECDLGTVSLYEFLPEDPGERLWTTEGTKWVPDGTTDPPLPEMSEMPTIEPSEAPSKEPSEGPSVAPSTAPSDEPSMVEATGTSVSPTSIPASGSGVSDSSAAPTDITIADSESPTTSPTGSPVADSEIESESPTDAPVAETESPSTSPTDIPVAESESPSESPTVAASDSPSEVPTVAESESPSSSPSDAPSTEEAVPDTTAPGVVAVAGSYCTPTAPCPQCYGDCDEDSDCEGDLVCEERNGGDAVTSCSGGENSLSDTDYCVDLNWNSVTGSSAAIVDESMSPSAIASTTIESPAPSAAPDVTTVSPTVSETVSPTVSETLSPTVTETISPTVRETLPPTIVASTEESNGDDLPPLTIAGIEGCLPTAPCDKCAGDCDDDSDCKGDLVCFQRGPDEMNLTVPGCSGYDLISFTDYCADPS